MSNFLERSWPGQARVSSTRTMALRSAMVLACLACSQTVALAAATPCTLPQPTGPVSTTGGNVCQLTALGSSMDAVFVFADAGGTSTLSLPGYGDIFTNHVNAVGDTVLGIPTTPGRLLDLTLTAHTVPNVFVAGIAASDGKYFAAYRSFDRYADFNAPPIGPGNAAYDYMAGHGGVGAWTFVAWEDFVGGDYDYNDLIFAFNATSVSPAVPEPTIFSAMVVGLAGLVLIRRKR